MVIGGQARLDSGPRKFTVRAATLRSPTAPFELQRTEEQKQQTALELTL